MWKEIKNLKSIQQRLEASLFPFQFFLSLSDFPSFGMNLHTQSPPGFDEKEEAGTRTLGGSSEVGRPGFSVSVWVVTPAPTVGTQRG